MTERSGEDGPVSTVSADDVVSGRMGGTPTRVTHGRWSVEVRGDEVADIRYEGVLLLRAIRPVVRDRDWNTVPVTVVAQRRGDTGDTASTGGTALVTELRFNADDISYRASLTVRMHDDALAVDFDGEALADFARNRIGLVILHPAADAGRPVRVKHTDGTITDGSWPTDVSPHQPFRDVAGFAWSKDGVTATLSLTGDVFETEDQRNWTDASFKTYSTPLERPFPVPVRAGETCRQGVRLTAAGGEARTRGHRSVVSADRVTVSAAVAGRLPPISVGACLYPPPAGLPGGLAGYETVLVELTGEEGRWAEDLGSAAAQAEALGAGLDVRIVTADADAVARCAASIGGLPVVRLGVFDPGSHLSTPALWRALSESARRSGFAGQLVGGTRAHFTELNRNIQQIPPDVPALTFSVTPQMHASEVPHLVDSLAMQRVVAENALRLAGGRPVLVGPITLARRFNAVATTTLPGPAVDAQRAVDPLQDTAFAAAWTLGSVAALAAAGVAGVCYFETRGPRGVVTSEGALTPAGDVLATLARHRGRPILHCGGPADVPVLAVMEDDGSIDVQIGNLSAARRTVTVDRPDQGAAAVDVDGWSVTRARLGGPTG